MDGSICETDVKETKKRNKATLQRIIWKGAKMEVTITFTDGSEISAELNGSCYITKKKPIFPEDLSEVTITGAEEKTYTDARVIEAASVDGRYWFSFAEETKDEKIERSIAKQRADIDYIAIVSEIDLEEA